MKTVHLGYEHRADDTRIVKKECSSLAAEGINTVFVTGRKQGTKNCSEKNLNVYETSYVSINYSKVFHPLKYFFCDYSKIRKCFNEIKNKVIYERPDIIHVHELKILSLAIRLKKKTGAKLIYDIHEDYPRQIENDAIGKNIFYRAVRKIQTVFVEINENRMTKQCDLLICATPHIGQRFKKIHSSVEIVCNYPIVDFNKEIAERKDTGECLFCYIGTFFKARGIAQMIQAFEGVEAKLLLGGSINENYEKELIHIPGWEKVQKLGYLSKEDADEVMESSIAGFVPFLPTGNNYYSLPNKIFEYLGNGIPVIASNFPSFREILVDNSCGICVDSTKPDEIRKAILWMINNQEEARKMGLRGYKAVIEKYNWQNEKDKLLKCYKSIKDEFENSSIS